MTITETEHTPTPTAEHTALKRLERWRDVGDGPIRYCSGDAQFAADVIAALERVRKLEGTLQWYADLNNYIDAKREVEAGIPIGPPITSIDVDCGAKARAALKPEQETA